jgi:hypothetical protein
MCRNPSLGLMTKAMACEGARQEWSLGVTSHAPKSVRDYEEMNLHTPKRAHVTGYGVIEHLPDLGHWALDFWSFV